MSANALIGASPAANFRLVSAVGHFQWLPADLPALLIYQRDAASPTLRVCVVGDIGLSGRAATTANRAGFATLFEDVAPLLRSADITIGNLESPLADAVAPGGMFAAPASGGGALRSAGFDVLHLANNHVGEYGKRGLEATLNGVRDAGIIALGAGEDSLAARRLTVLEKRGLRIGCLGCGRTGVPQESSGPHYWEFNRAELLAAVESARAHVDVLLVSLHIGLMYMDYPRPDHKAMAERLLDSGADLIVMHHAHVLQGVQVTPAGRVCCYNLGNFLYDWQEGNVQTPVVLREQNHGAVFWFEIDEKGIAVALIIPTAIDEACRVRWATGDAGLQTLERLQRISVDLLGDFEPLFNAQRASRNTAATLKVLAFHLQRGNWRVVSNSLRRVRWEHGKMLARWLFSRADTA